VNPVAGGGTVAGRGKVNQPLNVSALAARAREISLSRVFGGPAFG